MKRKVICIVVVFVIAVAFYLIGSALPTKYFSYSIKEVPLCTSNLYDLLISGVSAIFTLLAVIVALFRRGIIALFKKHRIKFNVNDIIEDMERESSTSPYVATMYKVELVVENYGNQIATDCELYFLKLTHKVDKASNPKEIEFTKPIFNWLSYNQPTTDIPQTLCKRVRIFEIHQPTTNSLPQVKNSQQTPPSKPSLCLNAQTISTEDPKGIYTAEFALLSRFTNPIHLAITLDWDGKWQTRRTEMNANVSVQMKGKSK